MRIKPLLLLVALFAVIGHLTVSSSTLNATPNPKVLWDFSNTGSGGYLPREVIADG